MHIVLLPTARHPHQAWEAAQKGLALDLRLEWINSNLVLAYLFQGKWKDAKAIYKGRKDKPYNVQRT